MREYHKALHNAAIVAGAFMHKTFANIHVDGPALSPEKINANPTMAVCTHRSHLDYVLLGIELHKLGLNNLRFAAGDNLTHMPYVGRKFTSYGAFSVYRARAHRKNYILELTKQVMDMLDNQDNIIVFPEGGRSYNGTMMEMKNGILAANVLAQHRCPERQYVYLPAAISYEKLPELLYFDMLQKGKKMRNRKADFIEQIKGNAYYYGADLIAFAKFFTAHKFGKHYGKVYIDYAESIAVNDIVDINKNYYPNSRNEFSAHRASIQIVGEEIRKQLLSLYRILPLHVVAAIVKNSGICSQVEVVNKVPEIITTLEKKGRNCKSLIQLTEQEIVEKGISQLNFSKVISVKGNTLRIKNLNILHYYAASIDRM